MRIIKNEVKLHQKSVDYINKTFGQYTEVNTLENTITDPILHLYPTEDTYDESGELNGYSDSIFFNINVYDIEKMTVWKSGRNFDGVNAYADLNVRTIKIFKDLSTMIVLEGEYRVMDLTAFEIQKVK